ADVPSARFAFCMSRSPQKFRSRDRSGIIRIYKYLEARAEVIDRLVQRIALTAAGMPGFYPGHPRSGGY
ncbi:MAG TPA: hypothetical protein VIJ35_12240, partial [Bradyrhizobium sp.]